MKVKTIRQVAHKRSLVLNRREYNLILAICNEEEEPSKPFNHIKKLMAQVGRDDTNQVTSVGIEVIPDWASKGIER